MTNLYVAVPPVSITNPAMDDSLRLDKKEKFIKIKLYKVKKYSLLFILISSGMLAAIQSMGQTTTVPFTTAGANTWFCPAGVTSITVECWGGGGSGGGATGNPAAGGGGAGGAYTKLTTISVSPGTTYNLSVGVGATGTTAVGSSGGSSWFNTNTTLLAVGGTGGALANSNNQTAAGATALTTGNIGGTTNYYGGNGGTGGAGGASGGGGGGSAGTASNGNAASGVTGGTAATGGGAGVNGSTTSGDGADNTNLGAGGAGGRAGSNTDRNGGNGGNGKVVISYTTPGTYISQFTGMSIGSTSWCAGETRTITVTVKNNGTAAWVDAPRQDLNIGVKWDADADYFVRTDVAGLAPGATGTFSLTVTAPATAGTNHLTFDIVYEAVSWFAGNNTVGPGNVVSTSAALTIAAAPADKTVAAAAASVCSGAGTNITIASSLATTTYQLRNNSDNSLIGTAVTGNGGTINLPTGNLTISTIFNVLAKLTASGCTTQMTLTPAVSVITPLASVGGQTNVSCNGGSDGTITIGASGGTAPYTYSVDNGATWKGLSASPYAYGGLVANQAYRIRVKDSHGCISK